MTEREQSSSQADKDNRIIDFVMQTGVKQALGASAIVIAVDIAIRLTVGKKVGKLADEHLPKGLARIVKFII